MTVKLKLQVSKVTHSVWGGNAPRSAIELSCVSTSNEAVTDGFVFTPQGSITLNDVSESVAALFVVGAECAFDLSIAPSI